MEKAMAPHSSTLAWKIPWMEETGRLQSMGSLRVGHDWSDLAKHSIKQRKRGSNFSVNMVLSTSFLLPGKSLAKPSWKSRVMEIEKHTSWRGGTPEIISRIDERKGMHLKQMTDTPMVSHLILLQSQEEGIISILLKRKAEQAVSLFLTTCSAYITLKFNKYLLFQNCYLDL